MRKSKTICRATAKATAILLTVCMLVGFGGTAAYAAGADQDTPLVVDGSQNPVEVGNITLNISNDDGCGVTVKPTSGVGGNQQVSTGNIGVTVVGDDSAYFFEGTGLSLSEGANASNTIETGGINVSVTADDNTAEAFGISVASKGSGHQTSIQTEGIDVTASGDDYGNAVGLDLYASNSTGGDNSSLSIAVDGDLTVHNDLTTAQGVRLSNDEGTNNRVSITVNGNVTATMDTDDDGELAEGMSLTTEGSGNSTAVVVDGDVTADRRGLGIITDDSGAVDVVVTGTISGRDVGIGFDGDINADNTSLTTWKIESDGVLVDDLFGSMTPSEISTIAKEVIHYIVKLVQPVQGDLLQAVKGDGSALETKTYTVSDDQGEQTVSTENEGNIVRLTLSDDRYEIVSAENADSGVPLSKDDKGFFYLVTRGGGILLSAILREKPAPGPEPQPQPQPQPSGDSGSSGGGNYSRGIKIIYELDGGVYEDDLGPIIRYCSPGQLIHLLDAPEKDGFEFGGWYREVDGEIETYPAGAEFRPWTTVTFTAIWNEA